ncbi:hypothetical protein [Aquibacillus salsiterrae]|nr:hypothetical protein [Aquibacillus salsiterrae]
MRRICEVCGRIETNEQDHHPYDILDVCPECTEHTISSLVEQED